MSTAYQVDLVFGTAKADTQLARMEQKLRGIDRAADSAGGRDAFGPLGNSAQGAQGKIGMLVSGLKAFAALGVVATAGAMANSIFQLGVKAENTEVRVRGLTKGLDDYVRFQEVAAASATKFGMSQQEAQAGLAQTYARLRPLGFTLSEVRDVYEGFNTAARNAGATAAESEGAFRQLAQALGSGALRGDEFNSIMEQTPAIGIEVAKVLGVNAGQLRELAAEGKLTGDVVLKALQNIRTEGADQLSSSLNTTGANVEKLKNRFIDMGTVVGGAVMPPILATLQAMNELLDLGTDNAGALGFALQQAMNLAGNPVVNGLINGLGFVNRLPGGRKLTGYFGEMLGYKPETTQMGPFLPEGLEQRNRIATQARIRAEKAAEEAAKKGRSKGKGSRAEEVIGGLTGGAQSGPSRGRSTGAHLHAQRVSGRGANEQIAAALEFPGGRTALSYGERRRPGYHDGYRGNDYGTPQGTPFRLRPGWKATDMGIQGALGRGMRISGPLGTFELGHLAGVRKGRRAESDPFADAEKTAEERQRAIEDAAKDLKTRTQALDVLRAQLAITRATTPEAKAQAEYRLDMLEIGQKYSDQTQDQVTAEAKATDEIRAQLELTYKLNDALLRRTGISGDILDQSRFTGTGAGARGQEFSLKGTLADTTPEEEKVNRLEEAIGIASEAYGGFMREIVAGTGTAEDALVGLFQGIADSFADMVAQMLTEWAKAQLIGLFMPKGASPGGGGAINTNTSGDLFSTGLGIAGSLLGSFAGGGFTGSGSRSGGIDGQGGFPAILHPNETVVDHTRGQSVGNVSVGGIVVNVATDGSTQVSSQGGAELARGIQAAVTAEILRQRRPGGALARG